MATKIIEAISIIFFSGVLFALFWSLCEGLCSLEGLILRGVLSLIFVTIVYLRWTKMGEKNE